MYIVEYSKACESIGWPIPNRYPYWRASVPRAFGTTNKSPNNLAFTYSMCVPGKEHRTHRLPYCHYRTSMELKTFHTPPNISRAIKARGMLHPHTLLQTICCTFFTAHVSEFFDFSLFLGNRCSNPCGYGYTNLFCMLDKTNRYLFCLFGTFLILYFVCLVIFWN